MCLFTFAPGAGENQGETQLVIGQVDTDLYRMILNTPDSRYNVVGASAMHYSIQKMSVISDNILMG